MPSRKLVIPLLLSVFVAAVVWHWPRQPMWRGPANAGRVGAISPDGKVLVTTRLEDTDPVLMRWDIESGALLSEAVLPCDTADSRTAASKNLAMRSNSFRDAF